MITRQENYFAIEYKRHGFWFRKGFCSPLTLHSHTTLYIILHTVYKRITGRTGAGAGAVSGLIHPPQDRRKSKAIV